MRRQVLFACLLIAGSAWAIDPEPPLADPATNAEYQQLIREVRCLVCQNQPISDSSAPLAADLRREIRVMFEGGASREEIEEFLIARYGDFVLYRPQMKPVTWALWAAPLLLLIAGGIVFARILRSRMAQGISEDNAA